MSLLSTVPKVVIIAMQVALVSLVLLAAVPIAMGGVDVNVTKDPEIRYNDRSVEFSMEMVIDTDLYFDITGFGYSVYLTSGGQRFTIGEKDIGTIKHTTVTIEEEISLAVLVMMMVSGASSETDMVITVELRGSTLMGMISADVRVDTVITGAVSGTVTVNADGSELTAEFAVPVGEYDIIDLICDDVFGSGGTIVIEIGGVTITINAAPVGGSYVFTVDITCSSGSTILEDLEAALATADADGYIEIKINGDPYTLTKADAEFIIAMLTPLLEGYL